MKQLLQISSGLRKMFDLLAAPIITLKIMTKHSITPRIQSQNFNAMY